MGIIELEASRRLGIEQSAVTFHGGDGDGGTKCRYAYPFAASEGACFYLLQAALVVDIVFPYAPYAPSARQTNGPLHIIIAMPNPTMAMGSSS